MYRSGLDVDGGQPRIVVDNPHLKYSITSSAKSRVLQRFAGLFFGYEPGDLAQRGMAGG